MRHPKSTQMMEQIQPGFMIPYNGELSAIVKVGRLVPDCDGQYASRLVIHVLPANKFHPFALHTLVFQDDEPWDTAPIGGRYVFSHGEYCQTIEEALSLWPAGEFS